MEEFDHAAQRVAATTKRKRLKKKKRKENQQFNLLYVKDIEIGKKKFHTKERKSLNKGNFTYYL